MNSGFQGIDAVLERLSQGPADTDELVLLVTGTSLDANGVESLLRRHARSQGFGQSRDLMWRLASDDPEIARRISLDLPVS